MGFESGVWFNGEIDGGVFGDSDGWEFEGNNEVVFWGMYDWGVIMGLLFLVVLVLFDEDKWFVFCCLCLFCLFGVSFVILVDMLVLVFS